MGKRLPLWHENILPVKIVALVKLELPLGRLLHEAGPVGLNLLVLSLNNARI